MPALHRGISTVIITQDEADLLARCIDSCRPFSDEILVVDGGSLDTSVAVAKSRGCRVVVHPFAGYARQRNLGAEQAAHDWIFSVDTDEVVMPGLARALAELRERPDLPEAGFAVTRVNSFAGRWIRGGAEHKVRLYDRRRARFEEVPVHETVRVTGVVRELPGLLFHYSYRDLDDATRRLNRYTTLEARHEGRRRSFALHRLLLRPPARFLQRWVLERGCREGLPGLLYALHWAYWEALREMKVYEIEASARSSASTARSEGAG